MEELTRFKETEIDEIENLARLRLIPYNARLLDTRKAKGWTQKSLSLLTGISVSYIGHIETLRVIPTDNAMVEISSALDASIDYLFPETLMEAMREGLFSHRVVELKEQNIIRLSEARHTDLLPSGNSEDEAVEAADKTFLKMDMAEVLQVLTTRERRVIELRFGLEDGKSRTLDEVGREFGVTRERIREIEDKALRKLRNTSRARRLKDYL